MATPIPQNQASFELADVARVVDGTLRGPSTRVVSVVTDSRAVSPGCLFVALRGETHDAHRFLGDVGARGAGAAIVARGSAVPSGLTVIEVDDTLVALGRLARHHRDAWGGIVVAITGSAGKTTTKELVRAAISATGTSVLATAGNLNNRIGVPMTLFGLTPSERVAVVEMGTSERGEIATLGAIGAPDVALVTLVANAHALGLGTIDDVAAEKGALFRALAPSGIAIANADDARVMAQAAHAIVSKTYSYGTAPGADVRVLEVHSSALGQRARISACGRVLDLALRIPGEAAALNAAGALAVVAALGLSVDAAVRGLDAVKPSAGRMCPVKAPNGALVVDDTYNANPRSMEAAIRTGASLAKERGGQLYLALADMKELGDYEHEAHAGIGHEVASARPALFVAIGSSMATAADVAEAQGVRVARVADALDAVDALRAALREHDVLVVKGSRSMRTERVVSALVPGGEVVS